jgi:nickel transport protein
MKRLSVFSILLFIALPRAGAAHEIIQSTTRANAVVVELKYADQSPFAYEQFEVYRKGEETPFQTGRTDALGRIVFVPDRSATWRVRAFSEDGHGTDFTIDAGPADAAETAAQDSTRPMKIVFGILMIFLVFLIVFRVVRRRA